MRRRVFQICVITLVVLHIVGGLTSERPVEYAKKSIASISGCDIAEIKINEFDCESDLIGVRVAVRAECGTDAGKKSVFIRAAKRPYFFKWAIVESTSDLVASVDATP